MILPYVEIKKYPRGGVDFSHVEIANYLDRGRETLPTSEFILPKFHISSSWRLLTLHEAIGDFLGSDLSHLKHLSTHPSTIYRLPYDFFFVPLECQGDFSCFCPYIICSRCKGEHQDALRL